MVPVAWDVTERQPAKSGNEHRQLHSLVLTLTRSEVRPFTDKQIELVSTFADQAAIAIENVRLFDEIQDKSRQLEQASQHKSQFLASMSHGGARRIK
jgi:GAF domain-containing protein